MLELKLNHVSKRGHNELTKPPVEFKAWRWYVIPYHISDTDLADIFVR